MKVLSWFFSLALIAIPCGCDYGDSDNGRNQRYDMHINHFIRRAIDEDINLEKAGAQPPGGRISWNEKWVTQIEHLREKESDAQHIHYIIEERSRQGLPDLTGL